MTSKLACLSYRAPPNGQHEANPAATTTTTTTKAAAASRAQVSDLVEPLCGFVEINLSRVFIEQRDGEEEEKKIRPVLS